MKFARITADCEAYGHPTSCTEPAPGSVVSTSSNNVTITNASGSTQELATIQSANIDIPTHCHQYSSENGCTDCYSHTVDPRAADDSPSVMINGSPVYLTKNNVQSDPGTGSNIDIINSGGNNSVTQA